ncbi:hypothetical protein N431DRAFT_400303 [Stipitochalara longipes BDJ]|nr:hypothetical protein N431DRAFT_400303 [Stipitochalara longipes BDJ]
MLQNSRWAPRIGDWTCTSCGFSNFAWRKECFRCSSNTHSNRLPAANGHLPTPPAESTNLPKEPGLCMSRWAPRNYHGRASSEEIWTRIVPNPLQTPPSATPKAPDLGLPYEVQHYILAMMQRIIEEACYDLASRWIPQKLRDKGWDCPEAVELSTWRDILPTALPPNAIVPHPTYSLERALADSVQIRNAAVHRHLCDNTEIRRMVVKAQDVMSMFADSTRRDKFHRLWIELNDWDQSSDLQAAKGKLLLTLGDISERPVDDMDWSPNSVSLQEITEEHYLGGEQYHGEAMDLD